MNTKQLKSKILDLAIHGKLVPQNPNDEPASKLLEKIREEKQKLIAEKKIKADKNDSYIFVGDDNRHYEKFADGTVKDIEDEIPFDVPEGWAWCKMKEILDISSAKRVLQEDWKDSGIPFYRAREIAQLSNGEIVKDDLFITNELYESLKENYGVPQPEDLMVSAVGTIGKTYIVKESDCFYYKDASVLRFSKRLHDINSSFLKLWIESDFIQSQMYAHSNGTTVDTITISTAQEYYFPLPPINEQIKITEEIIKLFQIVNNIETDKSDLQTVIKQAKSKILDLAIHGKLVPQDPSDESASVLLEKLRTEKEAKIKAGELKRDKNDSYIYKNTTDNCYYEKFADGTKNEVEVPFELPDSWAWTRLGTICDYGKSRNASVDELNDETWVLDLEDIEKDTGRILKFVTLGTRNSLSTKHVFKKGDILYSKLRPYLNKVVIAPKAGVCTSEILPLDFNGILINEYAQCLLMSSYFLATVNLVTYGVKMPRLGTDDAKKMLLPVPPLNEQLKIICSVKKLQKSLDEIALNLV